MGEPVKLLPCPFCGGEPLDAMKCAAPALWRISCKNCDAAPSSSFGKEAAIKKWNTRHFAQCAPPSRGSVATILEMFDEKLRSYEDIRAHGGFTKHGEHAELTVKLLLRDIKRRLDSLPTCPRIDREAPAAMRKALEFIRDGYDRCDINHVDFRVGAYKTALEALESDDHTAAVSPPDGASR